MLFNSVDFVIFMVAFYLIYWALPHRRQNLFILLASNVFYGWWDVRFLGLLWVTSLVDFEAARRIGASKDPDVRRAWLAASLVGNLGLLFTFKYLDWGIESLWRLGLSLGVDLHLSTLGLVLPVGISFYTFQSLGYTVDVYRGDLEPVQDPVEFLAFVAFFPHMVAGPIMRAKTLLAQIQAPRTFDAAAAAQGCREILWGFVLKVVLADNLATAVEDLFSPRAVASGAAVGVGAYFFAFQIYGDFAGYSLIASGCARLLGISLMRNFAFPYFSRSIAEFWHRWHISLSTWFRDYVYVPLGGSRTTAARHRINLASTFLLSGIWHGAGMNFVAWGAFHGALVAAQWWKPGTVLERPCDGRWLPTWRDALGMVVTFHLVCVGWVLFRAKSLAHAAALFASAGPGWAWPAVNGVREPSFFAKRFFLIGLVVGAEWLCKTRTTPLEQPEWPRPARVALAYGTVLVILLLSQAQEVPFIYFQF